jgi:hypothetical protein
MPLPGLDIMRCVPSQMAPTLPLAPLRALRRSDEFVTIYELMETTTGACSLPFNPSAIPLVRARLRAYQALVCRMMTMATHHGLQCRDRYGLDQNATYFDDVARRFHQLPHWLHGIGS